MIFVTSLVWSAFADSSITARPVRSRMTRWHQQRIPIGHCRPDHYKTSVYHCGVVFCTWWEGHIYAAQWYAFKITKLCSIYISLYWVHVCRYDIGTVCISVRAHIMGHFRRIQFRKCSAKTRYWAMLKLIIFNRIYFQRDLVIQNIWK